MGMPLRLALTAALVAGLTLAALTAATPVTQTPSEGPLKIEEIWTLDEMQVASLDKAAQDAWKLACEAVAEDCSKLTAPNVVYTVLSSHLYGMYVKDADQVIINIRLIGQTFSMSVMTHEMIHYIQGRRAVIGSPCAREEEAFEATRKIYDKYGMSDPRMRPWSFAKYFYPMCGMISRYVPLAPYKR
jgi:hypothetical protein